MSDDPIVPHVDDSDQRGPDFDQPHTPVQSCPHCNAGLRVRLPSQEERLRLPWDNPPFTAASSANYTLGRAGYTVHGVVIHTVVGTQASAVGAFKNPARGASAHYITGYDGSEIQMVDTDNGAWHCGRYYPDASHPLSNMTAVGIENDDQGRYNSPRPAVLYAKTAARVAKLATLYGFPIDTNHVKPHHEVSMSVTSCPDSLDVAHIIALAVALNKPKPPPPPPDTRPEWLKNLKANPQHFVLTKPVPIYKMATGTASGAMVASGALDVASETTSAGKAYWVTTYGAGSSIGNGLLKTDVAAAVAPVPVPPVPVPPTPPPPVPPPPAPPGPVKPVGFDAWIAALQGLLDFLKGLFGGSKPTA